jgi:hypothetical protein
MDLQTIVENTPRILGETAAFTVLVYPIFTGLNAMVSKEKFTDVAKKAEILYMTAGIGVGKLLYECGSLIFQ